ncbi:lanthionine synthetase C family protein [Actinosynnema sp. CS-041913]|uniref:lanthionine synthetase C family protein n=1 Tax=Actinosynnema sp. CS-041913 TaxID=3239917 RepID=UPI003D8D4FDD
MSCDDPPGPPTVPPEYDPSPDWGQSLSFGAAGIALLHLARAHAGQGTWTTAHRWIATMTRGPVTAHSDACLFRGAPAVAFVLRAADRPSYAAAIDTLDRHIAALVRQRLDAARQRIEQGLTPRLREFDLINGMTGLGAYLLHGSADVLLREVLSYLVRLATEPVTIDGEQLPGWWTHNEPADRLSPQWPGGHANLGIVHGIAGPLALLALAMIDGTTVPGQAEAIDRICRWLDRWRCGTATRPWWPGTIRPSEFRTGSVDQHGPQRPSWCYGTPGLARAQQLAALALGDRRRQRAAENALTACVTDDHQLALLDDASLCHGWAGLVQTLRRTAADASPDSELAAQRLRLHTRFAHHLYGRRPVPGDGLLEGTAGIALTRDAATAPAFRWDACLLITPPAPQTSEPLDMEGHK